MGVEGEGKGGGEGDPGEGGRGDRRDERAFLMELVMRKKDNMKPKGGKSRKTWSKTKWYRRDKRSGWGFKMGGLELTLRFLTYSKV